MPIIRSPAQCRRRTICTWIFLAQTERSISDTGNARPLGDIGENQVAARSRGGEKVEGLADTCFRQILGHRLPDEERRSLGPVAVVGRDIGEVLGLDIDGHQGDIGGYPAEELGQSRPLAVDVGGEIDFVDRRCGQDRQSVGTRVEAPESPRHRSASRWPEVTLARCRVLSACRTRETSNGSSLSRP